MLRDAGAAIAGIIVAFALIFGIEFIGHMIYPPPEGLDFSDPEAMRPYVASLPLLALLFPMFAWFIATFVGTLVASAIGTARPVIFAAIIGMLILAGTITNLIWIPHPLWFSVIAVIGIIASAWLAVLLAPTGSSSRTPSAPD